MKAHIMDIALFRDYLLNEKVIAETTARAYSIMLNAFLNKDPDIDNPNDYNNHIIDVSFKKRSYYAYYALKNYIEFKFPKKEDRIKILDNIRKPSMSMNLKRERRNLDDEKLLDIISKITKEKHQLVAIIQKLTGLRAGDILRIKVGNILSEKYEGKSIIRIAAIGKRDKRAVVEIFDEVVQQLILNYISDLPKNTLEGYYFLEIPKRQDERGNFVNIYINNYDRYYIDLKQALHACGITKEEFATHDFRRCVARKVWSMYKDLYVLQRFLGHSQATTSMRYLQHEGLDNIALHKELQLGKDK